MQSTQQDGQGADEPSAAAPGLAAPAAAVPTETLAVPTETVTVSTETLAVSTETFAAMLRRAFWSWSEEKREVFLNQLRSYSEICAKFKVEHPTVDVQSLEDGLVANTVRTFVEGEDWGGQGEEDSDEENSEEEDSEEDW